MAKRKYKAPRVAPDPWEEVDNVPTYVGGGRKKNYYYDDYQDPTFSDYTPARPKEDDDDGSIAGPLAALGALGLAGGIGGLGYTMWRNRRTPSYGEMAGTQKGVIPTGFGVKDVRDAFKANHIEPTKAKLQDMLQDQGAHDFFMNNYIKDGKAVPYSAPAKALMQKAHAALRHPDSQQYFNAFDSFVKKAYGTDDSSFNRIKGMAGDDLNKLGHDIMVPDADVREHWGIFPMPHYDKASGTIRPVHMPTYHKNPTGADVYDTMLGVPVRSTNLDRSTGRYLLGDSTGFHPRVVLKDPSTPASATNQYHVRIHPNAARAILAERFGMHLHPDTLAEFNAVRGDAANATPKHSLLKTGRMHAMGHAMNDFLDKVDPAELIGTDPDEMKYMRTIFRGAPQFADKVWTGESFKPNEMIKAPYAHRGAARSGSDKWYAYDDYMRKYGGQLDGLNAPADNPRLAELHTELNAPVPDYATMVDDMFNRSSIDNLSSILSRSYLQ